MMKWHHFWYCVPIVLLTHLHYWSATISLTKPNSTICQIKIPPIDFADGCSQLYYWQPQASQTVQFQYSGPYVPRQLKPSLFPPQSPPLFQTQTPYSLSAVHLNCIPIKTHVSHSSVHITFFKSWPHQSHHLLLHLISRRRRWNFRGLLFVVTLNLWELAASVQNHLLGLWWAPYWDRKDQSNWWGDVWMEMKSNKRQREREWGVVLVLVKLGWERKEGEEEEKDEETYHGGCVARERVEYREDGERCVVLWIQLYRQDRPITSR